MAMQSMGKYMNTMSGELVIPNNLILRISVEIYTVGGATLGSKQLYLSTLHVYFWYKIVRIDMQSLLIL